MNAALFHRDRRLVETLLAKGADVNMYEGHYGDPWELPALTIAAKAGNLEIVSLLLDNGADVNKGHSSGAQFTALQIAVAKGYISIVKCLIDHNADMNARRYPVVGLDFPGYGIPLEEAARWGRLDILQLLLESGVSTLGYYRVQYVLSIIWAQRSGHQAVAQALYNHRPWSTSDREIYQELTEFPLTETIFFHSKEYPEADFLQVITENLRQMGLPPPKAGHRIGWRWWKDKALVPNISVYDESSDTGSEGVTDGSITSEEDESESIDQEHPADSRITETTFQDESMVTTIYDSGDLGLLEPTFRSSRVEDSANVDHSYTYRSYQSIPEGLESIENNALDYHTLQDSFEGDPFSIQQSSMFQTIDRTMDTIDQFFWPYSSVLEWPEANDMSMSIDPWTENLEITFPGWRQDTNEAMEMGANMFEHSERQ
ncbi:hypothetical protein E8E14_002661 [Neopestalotiopsis sp. 37M]|nr:hypothetical protein E8E14_002661 [Neopestalotiopsis sp. 37M]